MSLFKGSIFDKDYRYFCQRLDKWQRSFLKITNTRGTENIYGRIYKSLSATEEDPRNFPITQCED